MRREAAGLALLVVLAVLGIALVGWGVALVELVHTARAELARRRRRRAAARRRAVPLAAANQALARRRP